MALVSGDTYYKGSVSVYGDSLKTFKNWECYMVVKYGNPGSFGLAGNSEYLLELPVYPDEVTESIDATWGEETILGRSSPIAAYAQTSLKSAQFSLTLHRDLLTGSYSLTKNALINEAKGSLSKQAAGLQKQSGGGPFDTRTWYVNANKMLQISCYPQYTSNGLIPPTTYFIFGQMILKGFVKSYSTTWKKPILNTFYGWNSVNITMDCYPDSIISAAQIISNSGAASTQNTYNTSYPTKATSKSDVMKIYNNRSNARSDSSLGGGVRDT